jgi:hemoglobin/transferrin/lactoferrin receptor protein
MQRLKSAACALALALVLACPAAGWSEEKAKEPTVNLDNVIVSARGVSSRVSETPGGVGVIKAPEISIDQPLSLTNTLTRIPGVSKSSDSAWGSAVNIRGLGRSSVVFNIDNCRVNTASQMNAQFGTIDPNDIERIEVLKGPISALYGSGSIGGVVNVITKKGMFTNTPEWHGDLVGAYTSNPGGFNSYASASFNSPDVWVYGSGSYRDHDSYEDGDDEEIHNSQFEDRQGKIRTGFKWAAGVTEFQAQFLEAEDVGIPGSGTAPLPLAADITYPKTRRSLFALNHKVENINDVFKESQFNVYYQKIDRRVLIDHFPKAFPMQSINPSADHETWGAKWMNVFKPGTHTLVAGIDFWNWHMDSTRVKALKNGLTIIDEPLPDADYLSSGLFLEDDWVLGRRFTLNLGGRLDYISVKNEDQYLYIKPPMPMAPNPLLRESETQNDTSWNLHAGLTWNLAPKWSMTFLAASAYRAASMEERFSYISLAGGKTKWGNPDLEPERSMFLEYGVHYEGAKAGCSLAMFGNFLRDLITEKVVNPTTIEYQNVSSAVITGAEAQAHYEFLPGAKVYGNVAYTRGEDTDLDQDLPFIPPLNGLVGLRYDHNTGLWGRVEAAWAASQEDVPPGIETTDGWQTVGLRLGYRFDYKNTDHELVFGADNVFSEVYRDHLSTSRGIELREPGLNFLAMYRFNF